MRQFWLFSLFSLLPLLLLLTAVDLHNSEDKRGEREKGEERKRKSSEKEKRRESFYFPRMHSSSSSPPSFLLFFRFLRMTENGLTHIDCLPPCVRSKSSLLWEFLCGKEEEHSAFFGVWYFFAVRFSLVTLPSGGVQVEGEEEEEEKGEKSERRYISI